MVFETPGIRFKDNKNFPIGTRAEFQRLPRWVESLSVGSEVNASHFKGARGPQNIHGSCCSDRARVLEHILPAPPQLRMALGIARIKQVHRISLPLPLPSLSSHFLGSTASSLHLPTPSFPSSFSSTIFLVIISCRLPAYMETCHL